MCVQQIAKMAGDLWDDGVGEIQQKQITVAAATAIVAMQEQQQQQWPG